MTVTTELKEIKEMLRKMLRDMTKIRQTQKQMKAEMYEVKDDLRRFRELWKRERAEIEARLQKLEEDKARRELQQRLDRFARLDEAIELRERKSCGWQQLLPGDEDGPQQLNRESEIIQKRIESIAKNKEIGGAAGARSHLELEGNKNKIAINEKNMLLKDGQRFIRQFFGAGKADL